MRSRLLTAVVLTVVLLAAACNPVTPPTSGPPVHPVHSVLLNTDPLDVTPHVLDGYTAAVAYQGDHVVIGGNFSQVKKWSTPTTYTRNYIFAYNQATGDVDLDFNPQLDGQVTSILPAPDGKIFVAGQFQHVNGASAPFLVKMDPATGVVDPSFNPAPNGMVYDIKLDGNVIYLGGTFSKLRNVTRMNFAAVDATTGATLPADVSFTAGATGFTRVMRLALSPDAHSLVAIGNFTLVGGQTRQNIAKLDVDAGSATVDGWQTDQYRFGLCTSSYDTYIRDVAYSPDGSYFVAVSTGAFYANTLCDTAARWENGVSGVARPSWIDYTGGDTHSAVAITGAAVYVAGHERWSNNAVPPGGDQKGPGALDRVGIAALDPESGVTLTWNPDRERGIQVWRLVPTDVGMYVLSDSSRFGNEWHPRLTYLVTAGGEVPPRELPSILPTRFTYAGSTAAGSPPSDTLNSHYFDGAALAAETPVAGAPPGNSSVRGVVYATDRTYRMLSSGSIEVSTDGLNWSAFTSNLALPTLSAIAYGPGVAGGGRVFYTTSGNKRLFARGFAVESGYLSTVLNIVSGEVDGLDWSDTVGLAVVDNELFHAHRDGTLRRTDLVNGAPVAATTVTLSGPGVDLLDWRNVTAFRTPPLAALPDPAAPAVAAKPSGADDVVDPDQPAATVPTGEEAPAKEE